MRTRLLHGGSMEQKKTFYVRGTQYAYTGEIRIIHGGRFFVGHDQAGREAVTMRGPDGLDPMSERARADWLEMQAGFRRLRT